MDESFEFGLARVLDGIEIYVGAATALRAKAATSRARTTR
jgi:hypothetical protein